MNKDAFSRQAGFTLTELLVSSSLSLSVIGSVLIGYLATFTSSMDTLAASRLNQDLNTLMSVMVNELRRAGYSADASLSDDPAANLFSQPGHTALTVFDDLRSNNQLAATGSGSCIVFAYDRDEDGIIDREDLGGFRLNRGLVQVRIAGNLSNPDTCAGAGNAWRSVTDPAFLEVTELDFDLSDSECLNTREPDRVDNDSDGSLDNEEEYDCYAAPPAAGSGDITVETRQVRISLQGNLRAQPLVRLSQSQIVRVRNDLVRMH